jgi:hypothetical protein
MFGDELHLLKSFAKNFWNSFLASRYVVHEMISFKFLEPLSILTKYKTSETPKIDNIFIYLRFDYISVIIRIN